MQIKYSPKMQQFLTPRVREEAIPYSFYHYLGLSAAAIPASLTFFNVAPGMTDGTGAVVTQEDTDMEVASVLTSPNRFFVASICVPILDAATHATPISSAALTASLSDDISQLVKRGFFQFFILSKQYLQLSPLGLLPAGQGIYAVLSAATGTAATNITNATAANGIPNPGNGYKCALALESQTAFKAEISFPKSTVTIANALRLGVVLNGVLFRPEQ